MKQILRLLACIMLTVLIASSCYQGVEYCDEYEEFYTNYCQKQPTGLVAQNVGDHYQKSADVWSYRFNLPGDSQENCDAYFLETKKFIEIPSVKVVKWKDHNVGKAYYTVHKIQEINTDSVKIFLKQGRETFMGITQNDGICDGGGNPNADNFYIRFSACRLYAFVGDTFGLQYDY